MNENFLTLRKKLDGDDPFMSGHQVKKIRTRKKETPFWAVNNNEWQRILLHSFPNLATNKTDRTRAARWTRAVHLSYRLGMPHGHVAQEMKISYSTLRSLLRNIRRAAGGLRADGTGVLTYNPRGRPKTMPHTTLLV